MCQFGNTKAGALTHAVKLGPEANLPFQTCAFHATASRPMVSALTVKLTPREDGEQKYPAYSAHIIGVSAGEAVHQDPILDPQARSAPHST